MTEKLKILMVSSEMVPYAKEGGLADVVFSLSRELVRQGHDVRVVIPKYLRITAQKHDLTRTLENLDVPMGVIGNMGCAVWEGRTAAPSPIVYFIEHEQFYGREGGLYSNPDGDGHLDNDNRFVFLSRAGIELCKVLGFAPDVFHVHDWHTAAAVIFLDTIYHSDPTVGKSATLLTIHNLQHQGEFYEGLMDVLGIGWEHFNFLGLEKDGNTNLLKGAIYHATLINTVSKSYAREIQTIEFGWELDSVLRERFADLYGILNGVDYEEWNPETDRYIAARYSAESRSGKAVCKIDLQRTFNLSVRDNVPIIGIVTRLVKQKGIDVLAEAIHKLLEYDVQLVILGMGEVWAHFFFGDLPARYPGRFGCFIGYDNALAHKIEAGADFLLMPSMFEPCGLNQLYSLRYGTLPIIRAVGGLNDTVVNLDADTNTGTGFKFYDLTAEALINTVGWALYTYYNQKNVIDGMIARAMAERFTWEVSSKKYVELYKMAIKRRLGEETYLQRFK
ncbi:MAG: glycogen synthase GlgA [Nitrospirae bacterium]|nr:glycogen synthase GlgA [Nitrospirota bacterium]